MRHLKKTLVALGVLAVVAVAASMLWFQSPVDAATMTVQPKEFAITLSSEGELKAVRSATISAPMIEGRLQIIRLMKSGTAVKVGDKVIEFDPTEKVKARDDAEFDIRSAEEEIVKTRASLTAELAQLRMEVNRAETEAASARLELAKKEVLSRIEGEKAELKTKEAEFNLGQLQTRMDAKQKQAEAELNTLDVKLQKAKAAKAAAERALNNMSVAAPIEGLLLYKQIWKGGDMGDPQEGDTVWPGSPLMEIPDLNELEVHAFVHESDGGQLAAGQKAKVRMDAFPDQLFDARIARINSVAQRRQWNNPTKYFTAILSLESSDPRMRPGMTTGVDIIVETVANAISIPLESIVDKEGKPAVYVRNGRGFELRAITLGKRNATHVVVEGGLNAGDNVALRDPTMKLPDSPGSKSESRPL